METEKKNKKLSHVRISNKSLGIIDNRTTENQNLYIKRLRNVPINKLFGSERKAAVAFFMSDLICKGFNDDEICTIVNEKYGLQWIMSDVRLMKKLIHRLWRVQTASEMNEQIQQEIASIDVQIKELWKAWEFSKKGISEKTTRSTNSNSNSDMMDFDQSETILKEDITAGDVKYMNLISELGKEKRKLLGLYAPEKKSNNDRPTAVQINVVGGDGSNAIQSVLEKCGRTAIDADAEVIDDVQEEIDNRNDNVFPAKNEVSEEDVNAIYEAIMNEDE